MRPWAKRSTEEANLLNPIFLASLIVESIRGYTEKNSNEAPFILPFIVIPLILHKHSRENLPRSVRTTLASWVTSPAGLQAKIGIGERARSLVPYIKEGVSISLAAGLIKISSNGAFVLVSNNKKAQSSDDFTPEFYMCLKSANYCGRWFACAGKIETVMILLGVKP